MLRIFIYRNSCKYLFSGGYFCTYMSERFRGNSDSWASLFLFWYYNREAWMKFYNSSIIALLMLIFTDKTSNDPKLCITSLCRCNENWIRRSHVRFSCWLKTHLLWLWNFKRLLASWVLFRVCQRKPTYVIDVCTQRELSPSHSRTVELS